jgi:hypothetical protein
MNRELLFLYETDKNLYFDAPRRLVSSARKLA